jgi:hypothetical protein
VELKVGHNMIVQNPHGIRRTDRRELLHARPRQERG